MSYFCAGMNLPTWRSVVFIQSSAQPLTLHFGKIEKGKDWERGKVEVKSIFGLKITLSGIN